MSTVIDSLVTEILFESNTGGLNQIDRRLDAIKKRIDSVSSGFFRVGTALTGALVGIGATVLNFEGEINALQAATNASAEDMARMREQAIQLGRDTQFSASHRLHLHRNS